MTASTTADEITVSVEDEDEHEVDVATNGKQNGSTNTFSQQTGVEDDALSREGRLLVASVFVEDALAHRHIGMPMTVICLNLPTKVIPNLKKEKLLHFIGNLLQGPIWK